MQQIIWLALGYQVPINPSKNRVYVWRKLKECGAGYFKQGVAILPKSAGSMTRFRSLAVKIREMGGEATLAELKFCDKNDEMETVARFKHQSEGEYLEFLKELSSYKNGGARGTDKNNDSVRRMAKRYKQMRARDYFKSASLPDIARGLDELIGDMSHATDDLGKYIAAILSDKEA